MAVTRPHPVRTGARASINRGQGVRAGIRIP